MQAMCASFGSTTLASPVTHNPHMAKPKPKPNGMK
jgi:hypothetical protein